MIILTVALPTAPLWIGMCVTLASAVAGSIVVRHALRDPPPGIHEEMIEVVWQRLNRDIDAVQVAAGGVSFLVAAFTDGDRVSQSTPALALVVFTLFTVLSTIYVMTVEPAKYMAKTWILTPFTNMLFVLYLGALIYAAVHNHAS